MTAVTLKKSEVVHFTQDLRFFLYTHFADHGVEELKVIVPMNSNAIYFRSVTEGKSFSTSMPKRDELMMFINKRLALENVVHELAVWECS